MSGLASTIIQASVAALSGAVAGSFLNVVIHRIPRLINETAGPIKAGQYISTLAWPPSHCDGCGHELSWTDNIPIVSYVALNGRCRACHAPYGADHLLGELSCAAVFVLAISMFGFTPVGFLAGAFLCALLALSIIDINEQLLPDAMLAPIFVLGLTFGALHGRSIVQSILGAGIGFAALWLIREAYRRYAGMEGMGLGDVKFAATIGAWVGIAAVPTALFMAFAAGTAVMLPLALTRRLSKKAPVPFGPFLAAGGACALLFPVQSAFFPI